MTMRLPVENRRTAQEPDAPGVPGRPGPGGLRGGAPTQDL